MLIEHATLETYVFDGKEKGPHLWISGNAHGNEHAGSIAIDRLRDDIANGVVTLDRGRLVLAPRLNTIAIEQDIRFVDSDLNRSVVPTSGGEIYTYEDIRRQKLAKALDHFCEKPPHEAHYESGSPGGFPGGAWVHRPPPDHDRFVLDLHTFHTPGEPHAWIYVDRDSFVSRRASSAFAKATGFAEALGVERVLRGWVKAYSSTSDADELAATGLSPEIKPGSWADEVYNLGFRDYARRLAIRAELRRLATTLGQRAHDRGATSITVECGQHSDPASVDFAYQAIRRALHHAGLIKPDGQFSQTETAKPDFIVVNRVIFRVAGDALARSFNDLEILTPGELVIKGASRTIVAPQPKADEETLILFPNRDAKIGSEIAYFATRQRHLSRT